MSKESRAVAKYRRTRDRIAGALDAALARARRPLPDLLPPFTAHTTLDLSTDRLILLSDLHRGARNGADDHEKAERATHAALAYYERLGYTLVLLGDVEELWEERPAAIFRAYPHSYDLEAPFHRSGRYYRVWGNHDDEWLFPDRVHEQLQPMLGPPELRVYESMLIDVVDGGEALGTLFLVHGHQGDVKSDRWSWATRLVIRFFWRPWQRLSGATVNTPATNWDLRYTLNRAMYDWAERQAGLVLIAGHTHQPVFRSLSHEEQIARDLAKVEADSGAAPTPEQLRTQAELRAQLEWVRAESARLNGGEAPAPLEKPCYFNTGSCSYLDGDITGLEIARGEIRLVRWPDEEGEPRPHVLARDRMRDVLLACAMPVA